MRAEGMPACVEACLVLCQLKFFAATYAISRSVPEAKLVLSLDRLIGVGVVLYIVAFATAYMRGTLGRLAQRHGVLATRLLPIRSPRYRSSSSLQLKAPLAR